MITNAREYQITKAQRARLGEALEALHGDADKEAGFAIELERSALQSEINVLSDQIKAYEDLYEGRLAQLEVSGLESLPLVLIKARIASRMSQKDLAERLGIHMQQVQRYEASQYRAVSFERMLEIAQLLGVKIQQDVVLAEPLVRKATTALETWGLGRDFLLSRGLVAGSVEDDSPLDAISSLERLRHVFGWSTDELERATQLQISAEAMGRPHFKLPGGRKQEYVQAYSAYAFRIACGAAKCAEGLPIRQVPLDQEEARNQLAKLGPLSLKSIIDWAWGMGIVIVPLRDRAGFNGAFWRIRGRNIIVLKQQTSSVERVMHDALHEIYHAAQEPHLATRSVIDATDMTSVVTDPEEQEANMFASNVLLNGQANNLAKEVAHIAHFNAPALKAATSKVARQHGVLVGALANHLAWVLQQQATPFNWWGTAQNLQESREDVLGYVSDVAFSRLSPPQESDFDAELLFNALRMGIS
jgi:transcriptional regulator with XRE-family HTH domain